MRSSTVWNLPAFFIARSLNFQLDTELDSLYVISSNDFARAHIETFSKREEKYSNNFFLCARAPAMRSISISIEINDQHTTPSLARRENERESLTKANEGNIISSTTRWFRWLSSDPDKSNCLYKFIFQPKRRSLSLSSHFVVCCCLRLIGWMG